MAKQAILLTNLGSPDSTEVKDVRSYLKEFLMDERVIDIPGPIRAMVVKGFIIPFRAPKSAKKYKTIWTKEGSPLIVTTEELAKKVAAKSGKPTYISMRYANPTPQSAFQAIMDENPDIEEVVMVPLYPHYAMSSYETAVVQVQELYNKGQYPFELNIVKPYYNHPQYIDVLAKTIEPYIKKPYDHLLFSYHGVPKRHITKSDITGGHCFSANCCDVPSKAHEVCYKHQVKVTTELVAKKLNLAEGTYSHSFQSRLGNDKWLMPYTDKQLEAFPKDGIKHLCVVCPAFVSDCLETLEEIHDEGKEEFLEAGGESYETVPCLNTHDDWVSTIVTLVDEHSNNAVV